MLNDYDFSGPDWDAAKEEAKSILIDVARRKGRIAYSELAGQIKAIDIVAHDPTRMNVRFS